MNRTNKVVLDIETCGGKNKPSIEDISAPSNYKDIDKIQLYKESRREEAWAKQALHPLKAEIICIGYAVDDEDPQYIIGETEKEIVDRFDELLSTLNYPTLIGHNVLGFDFPMLYLRAVKYRLPILKNALPKHKGSQGYVDIMQEVSSTLYGKDSYLSLKDVASFFGIEAKTEMNGSMVHQAYLDGAILDIAKYCIEDVDVTRKVYRLLNLEKPE